MRRMNTIFCTQSEATGQSIMFTLFTPMDVYHLDLERGWEIVNGSTDAANIAFGAAKSLYNPCSVRRTPSNPSTLC